MKIAQTKMTTQGQVSVPAEIRRRLGLAPGSVIEWDTEGDLVVVRRAGRYTSSDINLTLFPEGPPKPKTLDELRKGLAAEVAKRHARR